MKMSNFMMPYSLAMDIDKHFQANNEGALSNEDFYNVVETLISTGSVKNQINTTFLFKKLSKEEVIRRSIIISRLNKLLTLIKVNKR